MEGTLKWFKASGGTFSTVLRDSTVAYSGSACLKLTTGWVALEGTWGVSALRWYGGSECRRRSVRFRFRYILSPQNTLDFRAYLYVRDGVNEYYWMLRYVYETARWYYQDAAGGWTLLLQMGSGYAVGVWVEVGFEADVGLGKWISAVVNGVEVDVGGAVAYKFGSGDPAGEALVLDLMNNSPAPFVGWSCVAYVDDVLVMEL